MKSKLFKRPIVIAALILVLLVWFVAYSKTPALPRRIVEQHEGLYVPSYDSESWWQKAVERLLGECCRFDKPSLICIRNTRLDDHHVHQIGKTDTMTRICLESDLLTEKSIYSLANHSVLRQLTICSNQLTDDAFGAAANIPTLNELTLVSDSITGKKVSDLSLSGIRELYIKSSNLDHSLIAEATFPDNLQELVIVGKALSANDYAKYALNLPEGCVLQVSPPLPDLSSFGEMRGSLSLRVAVWDPVKDGACNCSVIP